MYESCTLQKYGLIRRQNMIINPLPNDKTLGWTKLKAFAEDK